MHELANVYYSQIYHCLMFVTIVLSSVTAVLHDISPNWKWTPRSISLIAGINTCLLALLQLLNFQTKKDMNLIAVKLYDSLKAARCYHKMLLRINALANSEDELKKFNDAMNSKVSEIAPSVPPIPQWIRDKVWKVKFKWECQEDLLLGQVGVHATWPQAPYPTRSPQDSNPRLLTGSALPGMVGPGSSQHFLLS